MDLETLVQFLVEIMHYNINDTVDTREFRILGPESEKYLFFCITDLYLSKIEKVLKVPFGR